MGVKCIRADLRRALGGRWFFVTLITSTAALYMAIGSQSYSLIRMLTEDAVSANDFWLDTATLLVQGLQGDFGIMTLPALSALPFAAQALTELKCGAIHPVIFRTGHKDWICGKVLGCICSGMLLQLMGTLTLALVFQVLSIGFAAVFFPLGDLTALWPLLLRRMLCGGIWACTGCLIALLTETTAAAWLAPLCLCYTLIMLGTRFFPDVRLCNPANWLTGAFGPLLLVLAILIAALFFTLSKKVKAYA